MAAQQPRASRAESAKSGAGQARQRWCSFCKAKVDDVDYKDVAALRRFVSEKGKLRSQRVTGACRRHQVQVAAAVKRAREMALLPYVSQ
jgi:small subunit ribosomal protein S18